MKISNWINKLAEQVVQREAPKEEPFNLVAYKQLLEEKEAGTLAEDDVKALDQVSELLRITNTAVAKLSGVKKEAAPPSKELHIERKCSLV